MVIIKLEVNQLNYDVGIDKVESIKIDREHGLVEIEFEEGAVWDKKIISIHSVGSILIKEEYPNIDPIF